MDDTSPATKADLERVAQSIRSEMNQKFALVQFRFEEMDQRMSQGFAQVNEGIDQVLTVLINFEKKITLRVDDHEIRIKKLERVAA